MLSPILIASAAIVAVAAFIGNIYFLVYFQHEEDKNQAYFPKAVVVFSLTLVELSVLILPFDVSVSAAGANHRQNMELLWMIVYMVLAFMLVVVVPFALYYYESWDPENSSGKSQFCQALQLEACTVISVLLVLIIMFFLLGTALVPYQEFNSDFQTDTSASILPSSGPLCSGQYDCNGTAKTLEIDVTFPVYTIGLVSFVGWFFFSAFGSVGLAALPLDLFAEFRFRPRKMPLDEFVRQKMELNKRANELKSIGIKLESEGVFKKKTRKQQTRFNNFRKAVFLLERDFEKLQEAKNGGGNPVVYWGCLLLAIVTSAFSICWIVHIILFMFLDVKQRHPFLNNLFVQLDDTFAFLGTVFYGAFSFYLIWATIKGCMKLGLRLVCFTIHPIKYGATLMNAFLFNVALILLCSVPVVQFCTTAFALYAHDTAIEMIFNVQITNLKFLNYFFRNNVFLYIVVVMWGLSFLYLFLFPSDRRGRRLRQAEKDSEEAWILS